MIIPREDDKVRLYLQLTEADIVHNGRVDRTRMDVQKLLAVRPRLKRACQVSSYLLESPGREEVAAALLHRFSTRDRLVDSLHQCAALQSELRAIS